MPIGFVPTTGFQPVDNDWLNGLAGGHNSLFQSGVTAAGTSSQTTATQLADRIAMFSVDTVTANSGVALPPALAGVTIYIANSTGTQVTVYPSIANNPATNAQDTINNSTSTTISGHAATAFTCPKAGAWYTN